MEKIDFVAGGRAIASLLISLFSKIKFHLMHRSALKTGQNSDATAAAGKKAFNFVVLISQTRRVALRHHSQQISRIFS